MKNETHKQGPGRREKFQLKFQPERTGYKAARASGLASTSISAT